MGFVEQTDRVVYIDNREFTIMKNGGLLVCDFGGKFVSHELVRVSNEMMNVDKEKDVHYTLKEIFEQPASIMKTAGRIGQKVAEAAAAIRDARKVYLTGSGSSYNACLVGKYLLAKHAGLTVEPIMASEAKFAPDRFDADSVMIAISQSGESADVIEAVRRAWRKKGPR